MKEEAVTSELPIYTHSECPVEITLDILGGKWKGLILYRLLDGKKRFGELKKLLPKVTHRTLTMQLRELEMHGIVIRHVYAEIPPKVEYSLSPLGVSIQPIIVAMHDWGTMYKQTMRGNRSVL